MKPVAFDLTQAHDVGAALAALGQGGEVKAAAGTQSLGPMLNLRLARPERIVDLSRVPELRTAREEADSVLYGAAITHAAFEDGEVPDGTPGWLAAVARRIAYRAVRNRGTVGGSLAHADPAADWVNVMTALGASVILKSAADEREVGLSNFFDGAFSTVLRPGEIIVQVRVPRRGPKARWAYWKFCRKVGEFAKASAAVLIDPDRGETRVLVGAIERPPAFLADSEGAIAGRTDLGQAVREAAPGLSPESLAIHVSAVRRAISIASEGS